MLAGLLGGASRAAAACTVTTYGLSFGAYNVFDSSPLDVSATPGFNINCSPTAANAVVTLSQGGAGSFNPRMMFKGSETLNYNIYHENSRTNVFGDGTGGTVTHPRSNISNLNHNLYGRIYATQDVSAGVYTDTVVVTITW